MPKKKASEEELPPQESEKETSEVKAESAPESMPESKTSIMPPPTVEMLVEGNVVKTRVYPQIRVGVCEFHGTPHGVVNADTLKGKCWHVCSTDPYCPHSRTGCEVSYHPGESYCRHEHNYNGLKVRCTYCPQDADMRGVIKSRTLYVFENPDKPNSIIMVCSDLRCRDKHSKRFSNAAVG